MPMRKKTIRRMPTTTRQVAKLVDELKSVATRLKNKIPELQTMEMMAGAESKRLALVNKESKEPEMESIFLECLACEQDTEISRELQVPGVPNLAEAVKYCPICGNRTILGDVKPIRQDLFPKE